MKRCGKSAPAFRVTGVARQTPPEARPRRSYESAVAQAFEGCSPEPAGRPLEAPGDGVSRWMVAAPPPLLKRGGGEQNPAYRPTRPPSACDLHVQLVGAASIRSAAYFEVRTKRVWWALWRKRKVWTQVSSWHMGGPPAGATVMTVDDVAALPGRVHTIGRVSGTGAVEY